MVLAYFCLKQQTRLNAIYTSLLPDLFIDMKQAKSLRFLCGCWFHLATIIQFYPKIWCRREVFGLPASLSLPSIFCFKDIAFKAYRLSIRDSLICNNGSVFSKIEVTKLAIYNVSLFVVVVVVVVVVFYNVLFYNKERCETVFIKFN